MRGEGGGRGGREARWRGGGRNKKTAEIANTANGANGAGPLAAGYLLWEMALARAKVQALSLVAAATPVLSNFLLCVFLKKLPGFELIAAAFLVSGGVVLSMRE